MYHKADAVREYLLAKPESWLDYPFKLDVQVFKIDKKMFATLSERDGVFEMNLKCDPDDALALRDIFPSIKPGYHMNKKHWNTVILDGSVPDTEVERMIDHSYTLVVKSLPRSIRKNLELKYGENPLYGAEHAPK